MAVDLLLLMWRATAYEGGTLHPTPGLNLSYVFTCRRFEGRPLTVDSTAPQQPICLMGRGRVGKHHPGNLVAGQPMRMVQQT